MWIYVLANLWMDGTIMYSELYSHNDLKHLCNDYKVDYKTRQVAYGLHKTNPVVAQDYVRGFPLRNYIERQRLKKEY